MTRRREDVVERAQRLRRRRGVAMVEGVVAIPFFILIFVGAMFVGGFYGKRIDAQGQARNETWKRAGIDNCDMGANGALEGMEIVDSADLGELSKSPLAALCDADFGSISYSFRTSHGVTGGVYSFYQDITATVLVPCNESPIAGDAAYKAAVEFLWDAYQKQGVLPANAVPPSGLDWVTLYAFGGLQ
jgi:hypothetical protein